MSRIHPTESKCYGRNLPADDATVAARPKVWTVWKKSSMTFQGTDGFSVYDDNGRLAFRVDNYSRKSKLRAGELVLMDGAGKALLSLRPQILSIHDKWNCYEEREHGSEAKPGAHLFTMRKKSLIQSSDEAQVLMISPTDRSQIPCYRISGWFMRRSCKFQTGSGEIAAEITRKKVTKSVVLGDDVFSLVVHPGFDSELIMAFVVVMDRIFQKPFTPIMCS